MNNFYVILIIDSTCIHRNNCIEYKILRFIIKLYYV